MRKVLKVGAVVVGTITALLAGLVVVVGLCLDDDYDLTDMY